MPTKADNKPKTNQSVEKAFSILELLADSPVPMRLNDIARQLDMNPSTALRFLFTLIRCGYVFQNADTMRYSLTLKLSAIGSSVDLEDFLCDVAHPLLHELAILFNETICLAVERDYTVVYIDVVQGPEKHTRSTTRIGNASFMHSTGIGKLLLTNYSDEQLAWLVQEKGLPRHTQHTITTLAELRRQVTAAAHDGCAWDNEECEIGGRCIAVPIYNHLGQVVAGISVSGTVFRLTDEVIAERRPRLEQVARELSHQLGWREAPEEEGPYLYKGQATVS
ncbi:IclR family transcriptional regulator [Ruminococcaceae bacterium OttesenSCG-928-O06]|nr:IclR family transcriptional regulator [Ruminococcaceae bacterium OttesenSCG-928-O06]